MRERDGSSSREERERAALQQEQARQKEQTRQQDHAGRDQTGQDQAAPRAAADRARLAAQQRAAASEGRQAAAAQPHPAAGQSRQAQQHRTVDPQAVPRSREPMDRSRDAARIQQIADRQRFQEKAHNYEWGHTFREHVDVTHTELEARVLTGVNARGQQQKRLPVHATRWQSDAACVVATDHLARSKEYERLLQDAEAHGADRFAVQQPLAQVLGQNWRSDVYGLSRAPGGGATPCQWRAGSQAVGIFCRQPDGRWHVYSCYPQPAPAPGP